MPQRGPFSLPPWAGGGGHPRGDLLLSQQPRTECSVVENRKGPRSWGGMGAEVNCRGWEAPRDLCCNNLLGRAGLEPAAGELESGGPETELSTELAWDGGGGWKADRWAPTHSRQGTPLRAAERRVPWLRGRPHVTARASR